MKVKVIEENRTKMGSFTTVDLLKNKIYEAEVDNGKMQWYRIVDESGGKIICTPQCYSK